MENREEDTMLVDKEGTEIEDTENVESVVEAVHLQSTGLVAQQIDESEDFVKPQELKTQNQNHLLSQLKKQQQSPAKCASITITSDTETTAVTATTVETSTNSNNVLNVATVQSQPASQSSSRKTAPAGVNNLNKRENIDSLKRTRMLQNAIFVQNMQAAILQSRNVSQLGIPRVGNLQNTNSAPLTKLQPSHMLRMGINRFGPNSPHFGLAQNRFQMAKLSTQATRFGAPRFGLQMRVPNVSQPRSHNPQVIQSQVVQTARFPQLCIPPWASFQQSAMQASQLHLPQNLPTHLQRPVGLQQFGHHSQSQLSSLQKLNGVLSNMKANSSKVASKQSVPLGTALQSASRVPQQARVPGVPGQFGALSAPQLLRNCPQFSVPQLPFPQVLSNASGLPLRLNMLSQPRGSIQAIFRPPPNIPQVTDNLSQKLAANLQRTNVPRLVNSESAGVVSLTTNMQSLRSSQITANVPSLNVSEATVNALKLTGNLLPRNMTQLTTNVSRPRVPYASNVAQLELSHLTKSIPRLPLSQLSMTIPQFPTSQLLSDPSYLLLPPRTGNFRVQSLSDLVSSNVRSSNSHTNSQNVIARATSLPHSVSHKPTITAPATATSTDTMRVSSSELQKTPGGLQQKCELNIQESMQEKTDKTPPKAKQKCMDPRGACQRGRFQTLRETQKIPGVLQPEAAVCLCTVKTSQQPASVHQLFESRKCIKPHTGMSQNRRKQKASRFLKLLQRKHIRHQMTLLRLWKQFKKYHIGKLLVDVHRKKLRSVHKQRCLMVHQQK